MKDERSVLVDRQAAAWLAEGPTSAPDYLLANAIARSKRKRQRPGVLARALGAPGAGVPARVLHPSMAWIVLALLALAAGVAIAGGAFKPPALVVIPNDPTPSADATPRMQPTPMPDRRLVFPDAGFAITVPPNWQIVQMVGTDSEAITLGTRYGLAPNWDPTYLLQVSVTSAQVSFEDALAVALGGRDESIATPIVVDAGRAVFLPSTSLDPPPLVLIEHGERVFTLTIRDLRTPGAGGTQLRAFAATFEPL